MDQLEDRWVPSLLPGPEFLVDSAPSPAAAIVVASAPDGRSIVVSTNLSTSQVNAQLYNADGSPSGTAFDVNQGTVKLFFPTDLAVAMDAQGAFVVTWNGMPTGSTADTMYARRYDATGTALGSAFQVTPDSFGHSALAVDPWVPSSSPGTSSIPAVASASSPSATTTRVRRRGVSSR